MSTDDRVATSDPTGPAGSGVVPTRRGAGHRLVTLLTVGVVVLLLAALVVVLAPLLGPRLIEAARPPEPCSQTDPTAPASATACVTPTAAGMYDAVVDRFGRPSTDGGGGPIREATCWSEHAWNPSSDHPHGRACDFFPTRYGQFPDDDERRDGWAIAHFLRENATELGVRYVIWDGRIWTQGRGDDDGWGRAYTGGGVYDPEDATGGHFDHLHVSVR